ncbi:hypothetical protein TRIATDRAFT_291092 [Trichoderma atroviride IMI 206040]|uniref:Uncharacterized protein n=1 Tax=Hypocrea atroviridis (strain ATCC 20476 / IMI 206040) TaxID=452589 RepID=G9NNZ8_HYPAI|nr:uncharacterized protein TRIATDRAFT_291092 [Trichoderma atroviride IMI 206040]EHK47785.1 hypothetical protein TRIATDRAFT_291092 [Trichoderma atroviride IMI 206040]
MYKYTYSVPPHRPRRYTLITDTPSTHAHLTHVQAQVPVPRAQSTSYARIPASCCWVWDIPASCLIPPGILVIALSTECIALNSARGSTRPFCRITWNGQ